MAEKKNEKAEVKKASKSATTNYAPDGHKYFCKRCFAFNGMCPKNGKPYADRGCSL